MLKAVFFDWFNTLAHYHPPREELESQALQELGIRASPQKIRPGLLIADRGYFEENALSPVEITDCAHGLRRVTCAGLCVRVCR